MYKKSNKIEFSPRPELKTHQEDLTHYLTLCQGTPMYQIILKQIPK